jgi:dTDP-4-amino-4,6-dideoxygalactose transaminase
LRIALENENIESRPLWKPMHLQPIFSNYPCITNGVSEDLFLKGLCLPSGSNLTSLHKKKVVDIILRLYKSLNLS